MWGEEVYAAELRQYLQRQKLKQWVLEYRYREKRNKDDYIQDPESGKMMGRKPSKGLTNGGGSGTIPVRDCAKIKKLTDIDNDAPHKLVKGFEGAILDKHWDGESSHKNMYPEFTKEQYAQRARELLEMPTSKRIRGYVIKSQGIIVRYDTKTKDYVKGHFREGIITMFKPSDEDAYYERKRKAEKD